MFPNVVAALPWRFIGMGVLPAGLFASSRIVDEKKPAKDVLTGFYDDCVEAGRLNPLARLAVVILFFGFPIAGATDQRCDDRRQEGKADDEDG